MVNDRPFVSSRSPSYARARRELEEPGATTDPNLMAWLIELTHSERDAGHEYQKAATHPHSPKSSLPLSVEHIRRGEVLARLVSSLGGSAGYERDVSSSNIESRPSELSYQATDRDWTQSFTQLERELASIYARVDDFEVPAQVLLVLGEWGIFSDQCEKFRAQP